MKVQIEGMYSHSRGTHLIVNLQRRFTIGYLRSKNILRNLGDCEMSFEGNFLCIEYEGTRDHIISLMKEIYGEPS